MANNDNKDNTPDPDVAKTLKNIYTRQSAKASNMARPVAFGAAAICWFFKTEDVQFPTLILISMISLSAFFVSDLLQYYTSTHSYYRFYRNVRDGMLSASDIKKIADIIEKRPNVYFHIKFAFLTIAYCFIALELGNRWVIMP